MRPEKKDNFRRRKRKHQATFIGHVMKRNQLENLVTAWKMEGKKDRGRPTQKMLDTPVQWVSTETMGLLLRTMIAHASPPGTWEEMNETDVEPNGREGTAFVRDTAIQKWIGSIDYWVDVVCKFPTRVLCYWFVVDLLAYCMLSLTRFVRISHWGGRGLGTAHVAHGSEVVLL